MDNTIQSLRDYFDQGLSINCKNCYDCCETTKMTQKELEAILRLLAKKGYKEAPAGKGVHYCEYLDTNGKCVVYEERPIVCRSHGKMDDKYSTCDKNDNFEKAIIPMPDKFLDYIENNKLFPNTTLQRSLKKYSTVT